MLPLVFCKLIQGRWFPPGKRYKVSENISQTYLDTVGLKQDPGASKRLLKGEERFTDLSCFFIMNKEKL